MQVQGRTLPALSIRQADSLASEQVIYHDRVVPFNTLARDFVMETDGRPSYAGLTPRSKVIGGWLLRPEVWQYEPMIYIKNRELCRLLNLETSYASVADLFDGQRYRLAGTSGRAGGKPPENVSSGKGTIRGNGRKGGIDSDASKGYLDSPSAERRRRKAAAIAEGTRGAYLQPYSFQQMPVHVQSDGWFVGILPSGILRPAPCFGAERFVTPDKPFVCGGTLCGIPFPALRIWSALVCGRAYSVEQRI